MVKLSVISQREVEDTLQDFEKRRYLILSALRAQKNLMSRYVFYKRKRPDGRWFASLLSLLCCQIKALHPIYNFALRSFHIISGDG